MLRVKENVLHITLKTISIANHGDGSIILWERVGAEEAGQRWQEEPHPGQSWKKTRLRLNKSGERSGASVSSRTRNQCTAKATSEGFREKHGVRMSQSNPVENVWHLHKTFQSPAVDGYQSWEAHKTLKQIFESLHVASWQRCTPKFTQQQ